MRTTIAILIALCSILYLLPTAVAVGRSNKNTTAVFILNLFLGWTALGWIIALIWAFMND